MKIINKYVLKEHVGPFLFALTALTSLLLLQYIARKFGDLVGKGLAPQTIAEFFVLSIPFTVAMTLPMAVLVSVLYAFARFGSENEITALKAGGVSTRSLMYPVLVAATLLAIGMLWFNDQVLPRSNHTLEVLQTDIIRTKPTFALREQVINAVQERRFYLKATHIDAATSQMQDVIIYDVSDPQRRRTIVGKRGVIQLTPNGHDLDLTLFDGVIISVPTDHPDQLDRVYFRENQMRVKDVANSFEQTSAGSMAKGDREMSICEMQQEFVRMKAQSDRAHDDMWEAEWNFEGRKGQPPAVHPLVPGRGIGFYYCAFTTRLSSVTTALTRQVKHLGPRSAHASELPVARTSQAPNNQHPPAPKAPATASAPLSGHAPPATTPPPVIPIGPGSSFAVASAVTNYKALKGEEARFAIEIQKKFSLAAACIVLALVGAPIALRFPRGGVGLVIGVSFTIFALYYVCLIGGESLANNLKVTPFWAMWAANAIFGAIGLVLFARMGYETATSRGGSARDLLRPLLALFARSTGRSGGAPESGRGSAS